jgi:hypothetical protein
VGEEDSAAAVAEGFMEVAAEGFTVVEVSTADIVEAATTERGAITEAAAVTAGVEDIGAEDTVTDGAGELALGGRIGVGDGDIHMPTTTTPGITRPTLILIRITVLRTIPRAIRILTTAMTILHRQIPTHGPCPTKTDLQDPGDRRYREAHPIRATEAATSRPVRRVDRFFLLTG